MGISITDFDSEQAAFDYCKSNKGTELFIHEGEFNVDGLVFPHYTNMRGAHYSISKLKGKLIMPNSQGGKVSMLGMESVYSPEIRSFKFEQVNFTGDIAVELEGDSSHNVFDMCRMQNRIGFIFRGMASNNYIHSGRSNCSEYHIKMEEQKGKMPNGNYIQSTLEGTRDGTTGTGAGIVYLTGKQHELHACWFERAKDNKYIPATIVLDESAEDVLIVGGRRSYLFSIEGNPWQYTIIPNLKMPAEYR